MSPDNTAGKPATPRRTTPMQALSGLFRTPTRLCTPKAVSRRNKRTRARTSSLSSSTSSTPGVSSLPAVVLQSYSVSTDSVVLTALSSVPFCCHEDLLTMSRAQLESVVRALNARLPRRMQIGPEDDFWNDVQEDSGCNDDDDRLSRMSEAEMRRRIEELVGIRAVVGKNRITRSGLGMGTRVRVPPAPKAARTRDVAWRPYEKTPWEMEVDGAGDRSDDLSIMIEDALMGSSPLAGRTRTNPYVHGRNEMLPRLAILQEENEGAQLKEDDSEDSATRPPKRQRVSSGNAPRDSKQGSQLVQEVRKSRLIENMDMSGSPLLAGDDAFLDDLTRPEETVPSTTTDPDRAAKTPEAVQTPLQRRRSVRIREIVLRRSSSVDTGYRTTLNARELKPSFLRSKTSSSRRSTRNISTSSGGIDAEKDAGAPKECTIRLPFTSTPPHQKPESSVWSAPRILRSHSQRPINSSRSTKTKSSLGRSQSEKYPRASDLAFVTITRPRYRFMQRKQKGTKATRDDQASNPSLSALPEHDACQSQQNVQIGTEYSRRKRECDKENDDSEVATSDFAIGNLQMLPSALCSLLVPRPRAPSTSTVASTHAHYNDSPARMTIGAMIAQNEIADSVASDGATERVWEALGRMAVDSV